LKKKRGGDAKTAKEEGKKVVKRVEGKFSYWGKASGKNRHNTERGGGELGGVEGREGLKTSQGGERSRSP